jgi:hypothetical protein
MQASSGPKRAEHGAALSGQGVDKALENEHAEVRKGALMPVYFGEFPSEAPRAVTPAVPAMRESAM